MVQEYSFDLINYLRTGEPLKYNWRIPEWVEAHRIFVLSKLETDDVISRYTLYHDIGKPFCLEVDENGKTHFPDHAKISEEIYRTFFEKDTTVLSLIKHDMDIHLLKSERLSDFCCRTEAITSLIVGLAEVHANADLFGGIDSVSFKIKWKHLNKFGNRIVEKLIKG